MSFKPEFFAVKGKVLDDDEPIPIKPKAKRPTRKPQTKQQTSSSTKNPFRFPSIQNEEIFESKLQESPLVNSKKYKTPEAADETVYSYSTINFGGDDNDDSYVGRVKSKAPKRSTSINPTQLFHLEQSFGQQKQVKFDKELEAAEPDYNGGFKPSVKFAGPPKGLKKTTPPVLFKSTEDDFKSEDFYDFSIRPRPGQSGIITGPSAEFKKFKSELGVKALAIKSHKNKFDPQLHTGFKPSFKLRDFPHLHGAEYGSGIASPGQIKTFYDAEESTRDERIKQKLANDPKAASQSQYAQFLRAKEDERLEKLVEEQFRLQEQKKIAQEKEAELKLQQQVLHRQKEKLKQVEKQLNNKVTRQTQAPRQKRRPGQPGPVGPSRRQRNPNPINFSVAGNGQSPVPLRTLKAKDGSYRVSFNVQ